jgi:hypothetical protein
MASIIGTAVPRKEGREYVTGRYVDDLYFDDMIHRHGAQRGAARYATCWVRIVHSRPRGFRNGKSRMRLVKVERHGSRQTHARLNWSSQTG